MRVLVVSAHYPPNFISGGTLGPQRIAHGLVERGHDVSVYAGWLGDREPLTTWTDEDEVSIPVRWIVVSPWIDWSSRGNFDNPDVTIDFRLHLEDLRPDVVHFHSLQALGGGVVSAAADAGIPVVVTMHDFWWICARQFLSNRATQPCSLVVSCGMCPCQVDRRHLDERNADLLAALGTADVVLAVSESQASVLRANGIGLDPDGPALVVDENGLPPLPELGRRRLEDSPVNFLYTGGSEPLKGVHVVADAARALPDDGRWELDAYGTDAFIAETGYPAPAAFRSHPPFVGPEETERVYDRADVLILASVVRESHSLVTREALARGIPVITTDSIGPEEVVVDGVNGVIVPTGDPAALAEAMRRIIEQPELRRALADGARRGVAIRPLADQIDEVERRLHDLVGAPRPPARRVPRTIRSVLFIVGIDGAPLRYRGHFAAEALGTAGVRTWIRHYRSPENAALAATADAVVVYRVPATHQMLALVESVRSRGVPVLYDVDDLVFDPEITAAIPAVQALPPDERALYDQGVRRYRTMLEACDAYIGSTQALVDHVEMVVGLPAHRWWNGVGIGPARCADAALAQPRSPGPLRVGYMSGTKTHDHDWQYVEPAIVEVLDERPDVQLWLGGLVTPTSALDRFGERVRRIPMKPWWELPWALRDLDVNLAPLAPGGAFNEAKSAIKWLEAALAETVTVASPTGPFQESIVPGVTGELADAPAEFAEVVLALLDDDLRRQRTARRARREALLRWSPHLQGRRYLAILEEGAVGRTRDSSWNDAEATDEPWTHVEVEGYTIPDPMLLGQRPVDFVAPDYRSGAATGDGRPAANPRAAALADLGKRVSTAARRLRR